MKGYLSCMKFCCLLLGNSSSGFVEASYFSKPVVNLGNRQRGRIITNNIFNTKIIKSKIIETVRAVESLVVLEKNMIYGDGKSSHRIKKIIKDNYGNN
jgi:GDP/UDP-N,N'-diacetylbacillosamine 2-epimerase (hydrolysing)